MGRYKTKIIIWSIVTLIAFIGIITLSVLISNLEFVLNLSEKVTLDQQITDTYKFIKSYSIGGLAFSIVVFVIGSIISYAGYKSWKYVEMFS
ncbi:hypothetical protein [Mycoplasma sp. OR1901]|uniref:hypothetical protein n=1 Tax=Mycoplasma sp. OR1901 TaxID=2742195 RepID=UPI001583EEC5|nr:hypothetical protein [Mycoplasma sp. OR1901]QKT05357.1 hypothetical protein HTZ87_01420 [Mycoplasma sp. OR1901]